MSKVADTHLNKITGDTIGQIGKYNQVTTNQLFSQYQTLLADNRLVTSLNKDGWTPWLDKALEKRGIAPEVISQLKGQTTTKKIVSLLETQGIRGGKNPREVSRSLIPHVQRFFGPEGVIINNVGKFKKVLKVDADGNFKYVKQAITRPYRATPKAYSNLLARSSMISAHNEGRYQSVQKTGLVDHYISKSTLDANTCNLCATMHGQRVSHSDGPLYHPSCACDLKPIWKKDSGISNKDPSFYDKQRDQHFWKRHQLAEYNKGMPRGAKLKFHSMLPKDALVDMPGKEAMRTIRYNALGKPAAIKPTVVKSKVTKVKSVSEHAKQKVVEKLKEQPKEKVEEKIKKVVKKKIIKEKKPEVRKKRKLVKGEEFDDIDEMITTERKTANELWEKTAKDGNEHGKISNSKTTFGSGDEKSLRMERPKTQFNMQHTHPGSFDSPFSGADIANFLRNPIQTRVSASSSKHIYVGKRTSKTKAATESFKSLEEKHSRLTREIMKKKSAIIKKETGWTPGGAQSKKIFRDSIIEANEEFAKEYNFEYYVFKRK
jgi:hypothetical protein